MINSPSPVKSPAAPVCASRVANKPLIKNQVADEYLKRKEEMARNKARGRGVLNSPYSPKPPIVKRDEKSIYEEQLRKIRLQNYNNRRAVNLNRNSRSQQKEVIDLLPDNKIKKIAAFKVKQYLNK
jgi:hypothetical protein